jgi:CheY-like chemotaxis protein
MSQSNTMAVQPQHEATPFPLSSVLLVEDHGDSREVYALELAGAGFAVRQVASAEEALERVLESVPDVLVTDIALPGMSGTTLCRHVRRLGIAKDTKVLGVTSGCTAQELEQTTSAGFDAVLVTPCLPQELVGIVRELLVRGRDLRRRSNAARAKAAQSTERSNRLHLQTRVYLVAAGIAGVAVPCPSCRQPLTWRETNRINQIRFDYFQPCLSGCGEYLFDHLRRRLVKLR